MIDPKDIRIGNLVEFKGQYVPIVKIDSMNELIDDGKLIYKGSVAVPEYSPDGRIWNYNSPWLEQVNPIPITDEWLQKFSFGKLSNGEFVLDNFRVVDYYIIDSQLHFSFRIKHPDYTIYHLVEIKHVHQLQNIYYALTQEELTLK